jgi:Tol biopolymer transport system component
MIAAARFVLLAAVCSAGLPRFPAQAQTGVATVPDSLVEAIVYTTVRPPNWDIYLFEEPAGTPRRLTDDPALDYNAVFSPDGRWLVFTSERAGNADLYALDLQHAGPPIRLTRHHAMDDAAAFSPDGRRLAFVSTRDGYADIFVMPFSLGDTAPESRAVNLTRLPGGDFNPAFSPDGRRIAFSRQEHLWPARDLQTDDDFAVALYVMDADGSSVRRISEPGAGLPWPGRPGITFAQVSGSPAWSRDGRAIYYYRLGSEGFEIRRVTPESRDDVRIARDGLSPAVRPDGRIAFVRPPADPGPEIDSTPRSGNVVTVGPDGSYIRLESTAIESCFAPDFDSGSGRMVCHGPGPVAESVPLVGDGRMFAQPGAIRQVELPDRTVTVRGIGGYFPALTPSGEVLSTLRFVRWRAGLTEASAEPLHVSAVDGSGLRELFTPPAGIAWGAAVAKDADLAVVAEGTMFAPADARVDVWRIRLDGSEAVNLTADSPANDALPHVTTDGSRIAFRSSRGGNTVVYVMDGDGQNVRRVTDTTARETMPALSPDGVWVVFPTDLGDNRTSGLESPVRKLWLQRVDGSEGRLLEPERSDVPDLSMHPRFSPDGKWVVFTSNRGGFNDEWPLTWYQQPYGELWAVPVDGGPAVRLTHDKWEDGPSDWGHIRLPAF